MVAPLRCKWYCADNYNVPIQKLLRKNRKQTRVTFITGNHDAPLGKYLSISFGATRLSREESRLMLTAFADSAVWAINAY